LLSPNLKPAGSSNGESVDAVIAELPVEVIVPGVTVEPVTDESLQHKSTVPLMFVNGLVGGLNDDVYTAVPLTTLKLEILVLQNAM
jgi:hypothetical protein